MDRALLVVSKRPEPGKTKTRLTPLLSAERAAQLYECLLRDTLDIARRVPNVRRWIAYAPVEETTYFQELAPDFSLVPQVGHNLGERLDHALTHVLGNGAAQAVIMDSDSPTLPADYVTRAFVELEHSDVVLGPCEDGGYYLIGLTRPQPRLLRGVKMSTPHVLHDTLEIAEREGLRTVLLPSWYDVDTPDELARLEIELASARNGTARHTRGILNR